MGRKQNGLESAGGHVERRALDRFLSAMHMADLSTLSRTLFSPGSVLLMIVGYLVTVFSLRRWMNERKPFKLVGVMRIYNVVQVATCFYMCQGNTSFTINLMHSGLYRVISRAPSLDAYVLGFRVPNLLAFNTEFSAEAEYFVFLHFCSKILDFCDTIFIVMKKKDSQLSFLHLYHHSTIIAIWAYLLHIGFGGGAACFGALINSAVHIIMYSHYFITTYGIENPFKLWITRVQIIQFYMCVLQAILVVSTNLERSFPAGLGYLQLSYHFSMIALFSNFLRQSKKAQQD